MTRGVSSERRIARNLLAWNLRHNSVKVLEDRAELGSPDIARHEQLRILRSPSHVARSSPR